MPRLRAFRALRYPPAQVPDLSAVLCPPYDIISAAQHEQLLARDPHNAVRLELPMPEPGGDAETRYRSAARTLAEWRSGGILVKDRRPGIFVHEMRWTDAAGVARIATGFLARCGLEPFVPGSGVRPHERTMTGPKEDRYRLLKATGTNLSPVVLLHEAGSDATRELLGRLTAAAPDASAVTDDGVAHRVWACPADGDGPDGAPSSDVATLVASAGSVPHTIADGHHRYETALRYRDERGANRACESDPAWDSVLVLTYEVGQAPPVLATHRVLGGGPSGEALLDALDGLVDVERVADGTAALARMGQPVPFTGEAQTGTGRFGVVSGGVSAIVHGRRAALEPSLDPALSPASRGLDVNLLAVMLGRLGIDAEALAAGAHVTYVKSAPDAVAMVERGAGVSAFLLDDPPVTAVTRVAAAGEVMPQKSTYFHPKAPTGLLFGPLEW